MLYFSRNKAEYPNPCLRPYGLLLNVKIRKYFGMFPLNQVCSGILLHEAPLSRPVSSQFPPCGILLDVPGKGISPNGFSCFYE